MILGNFNFLLAINLRFLLAPHPFPLVVFDLHRTLDQDLASEEVLPLVCRNILSRQGIMDKVVNGYIQTFTPLSASFS